MPRLPPCDAQPLRRPANSTAVAIDVSARSGIAPSPFPSSDLLDAVLCSLHSCQRAHTRSEEHTSELQSRLHLVCRLLLEKKKKKNKTIIRKHKHGELNSIRRMFD